MSVKLSFRALGLNEIPNITEDQNCTLSKLGVFSINYGEETITFNCVTPSDAMSPAIARAEKISGMLEKAFIWWIATYIGYLSSTNC